jgi:D-amino peptidase
MKVYVSVDMEGISGVVDWGQVTVGQPEYERGRKLMTADANAAVEGALAGGATEVLVVDSHGPKMNLLVEELHPEAELIRGRVKPMPMLQGIDEDIDLALFIGYHAKAGSLRAILNHTWYLLVLDVTLNGQPVGELGFNAATAGHYGVPVGLVSGDQAVVDEGVALLGDIETVVVKTAYGMNAARCVPTKKSVQMIRDAAERAVRRGGQVFAVTAPVTLGVSFHTSMQAEMAACMPGTRRVDGRSLEFVAKDMVEAHNAFRSLARLAATAK